MIYKLKLWVGNIHYYGGEVRGLGEAVAEASQLLRYHTLKPDRITIEDENGKVVCRGSNVG